MTQLDERGKLNILLIPLILLSVLFVAAVGFGAWAFSSRNEYKNEVDPLIAKAVSIAEEETRTEKDKEFVEKEKQPLREYRTPEDFGSALIKYPKTWSAYVAETATGTNVVDASFHPSFVPAVASNPSYALRVQIVSTSYEQVLKNFDGNVKNGKIKASPFRATQVQTVLGTRLEGEVVPQKQGTMILLPLRDKTLKIWTENNLEFLKDFDENILPNLTFTP
jgi:hypothetical protein